MTVHTPLYSPAELDAMTADAERIDMTFEEYVEHLQASCVGHAAALITHPELRPPSLANLPVMTRLTTIALLDAIDNLIEGTMVAEVRAMLATHAEAHIKLIRGGN